jgi:hypothetical protein
LAEDSAAVAQFAKLERLSAIPGAVKSFMKLNWQIDVSLILPAVRVPTLVLHRRNDANVPIELGRELAVLIPDAKFIEYPGSDHSFVLGDVSALAISKSLSLGIVIVRLTPRTRSCLRFCSQILSIQRAVLPRKAIRHGEGCWIVTIN